MSVEIKFMKAHPEAILPTQNTKHVTCGDSGYDVYSVVDTIVEAHSTKKVNIGLEIAHITPNYWIRVESRSGLFFKKGITAFNGIIDNSYRGELGIALINNTDIAYRVNKFDRIAQLVVYKLESAEISWSDIKEETSRGDKGFGSSGF